MGHRGAAADRSQLDPGAHRMSARVAAYRVDGRSSADRATDAAMSRLRLEPGGLRDALRRAIQESAYNVSDWAGSGDVTIEENRSGTSVVIVDSGPGIHGTMRESFPDLSGTQLLLHAVQPGITSTGEQFRGFGLWSAVQVSNYGAEVTLESGGVAVLFRRGRADSCSKSSSASVGTVVRIALGRADS